MGKSTLFNRLIEEQKAIVSNIPGTTRTNNEGLVLWRGQYLRFIDTGGLTFDKTFPLEPDIQKQSARAVVEADLVIFVTDGRTGVLPQDRTYAKRLRTLTKAPILVVANKVDNATVEKKLASDDWRGLGFAEPFTISAANGRKLGDFLDLVMEHLPEKKEIPVDGEDGEIEKPEGDVSIRVSIIGKPNVGKSSLFNKLIGEDKVIVSPMPHTTREPHDTLVMYEDQPIVFVDTAGIRRKANVSGELEQMGISKSIQAIEDSDIVLLVLDGSETLSAQDLQLGGLLEKRAKSVIILLNKWDLATDHSDHHRHEVERMIYGSFPHLDFAPIHLVSGLTGYRAHEIFPLLMRVWQARHTSIPDATLGDWLKRTIRKHLPTKGKGSRYPVILGMRQLGVHPPVFEIFVKQKTSVHASYIRYLENRLREQFDFTGTPVIMKISKMKR